ncbi:urokinase plasminogen activator surface receptor-like [Megalobrama amblycephala]|uniref:urokinase plasminogen activator surface receptor-like n=1 Tax=Megalobrama amblycephala TaxID=75352 RepID=UPI0020142913|nr:urokinase plasminogen activator surface receptor-like [Megalobrama amblycephala]
MDLQISVFLLFILFTAGHSLRCYECKVVMASCAEQTLKTCPSGSSHCVTSIAEVQVGDTRAEATIKDCDPACQRLSANFGVLKTTATCCDTDECNLLDADPSSKVPNGNKCYSCDGKSCSNIVTCLGTEDRCVKATATIGGQAIAVKGCVSKSLCNDTTSVDDVQDISCCEGNLCNGAQSVSQSFLFLCCSLLSYFLLH